MKHSLLSLYYYSSTKMSFGHAFGLGVCVDVYELPLSQVLFDFGNVLYCWNQRGWSVLWIM